MGDMVSYRSNGGTSEGYLAIPASGTASPAVIVLQESWGLVPHIRSVADRFAEAGFVALVPNFRHGAATSEAAEAQHELANRMAEAAKDVAEAADYLAGRPEVTGKVGAVGFGAGASLALRSATRSERIVATAGFYPALSWESMRSDWVDYAGKAAIIHCSDEDGTSTDESVQAVRRAVEEAGGTCQIYAYPGTSHGFFDDDRPEAFDQRAAASAWARTLELFRAKLG
ncbi:dienelactone hydrolase family protein [Micromonospora sp. RB23]